MFDFFVFSLGDKEVFIDIHQSRAEAFKKFLEFYKLNSDVTIFDKACQVVLSSVQQETCSLLTQEQIFWAGVVMISRRSLQMREEGLRSLRLIE